jgi:hypothetical protein
MPVRFFQSTSLGALPYVRSSEFSDRVSDAHPMTCRGYTNVVENLIMDLPQQLHVNFADLDGIAVSAKTNRLEPLAYLAHGLSCSSSVLAFFKSSVSKPSVNQP